ncbi:hypothetical protein VaNZ11_011491 [Volvox africanus]|uniref:Uncharacterized protein n=1 Tax=Volvox africanus TaxID=51714 RepID=A0ABQ5SBM1_9CHLO|nr:hypothetical protein VaNZ11_011491 [Volvox africanus]
MRPMWVFCGAPAHGRRAGLVARTVPAVRRDVRAKGGVYVPSDSFGGQSPERKAAGILRTFFTFIAARIVLAQLEGSGRGALGAYDSQAATDLHNFLQNVAMKDGDEWLAQLMRQNTSLGLRLMEVRDHYCDEAFEWGQLQQVSKKDMRAANTKLMRQFAAASLAASLAEGEDEAAASSRSLAGWRSAAANGTDEDGAADSISSSAASPDLSAMPTSLEVHSGLGPAGSGSGGGSEATSNPEPPRVNEGVTASSGTGSDATGSTGNGAETLKSPTPDTHLDGPGPSAGVPQAVDEASGTTPA